jgi:hypothetical protein
MLARWRRGEEELGPPIYLPLRGGRKRKEFLGPQISRISTDLARCAGGNSFLIRDDP